MYNQTWVCFFGDFFTTVSSKMLLYEICISGCECFTFVSFSLSLCIRFVLLRNFSDHNHNGAPPGRIVRLVSQLVTPQFITNSFRTLISRTQCSILCFSGNRGRTSRRRFRGGKSCRIGLSLTWRSSTTTPSPLCTLTPWKRSRFSVATRFSSWYHRFNGILILSHFLRHGFVILSSKERVFKAFPINPFDFKHKEEREKSFFVVSTKIFEAFETNPLDFYQS